MLATIIIALLIAGYAGFVIRRKVRDAKAGKFCSCGCSGCTQNCRAKNKEKENT